MAAQQHRRGVGAEEEEEGSGGAKNSPMTAQGWVGSCPTILAKLSELWLSRFDCARNARQFEKSGMSESFEKIAKIPKSCYLNLNMLLPKFFDLLT